MDPTTSPAELPLRDIHLPEAIGWWPPAPGWWVVVVLAIALLIIIIQWLRHVHRNQRLHRDARRMLYEIEQRYQEHQDARILIRELSSFLRRVAISAHDRNKVASLTGDEWLNWLDTRAGVELFNTNEGRQLTEAPYKPDNVVDVETLLTICRKWLQTMHQRGQLRHA